VAITHFKVLRIDFLLKMSKGLAQMLKIPGKWFKICWGNAWVL